MKVKAWQIIVIVLGLLVGGGGILWASMGSASDPVNYVAHYIDVETGDIYRVDTKKRSIGVPGRHPTSGRVCLVRIARGKKDENSKTEIWIVRPRDLATIRMLDKGVKNNAVNEQTGELLVPEKTPIEYVKQ